MHIFYLFMQRAWGGFEGMCRQCLGPYCLCVRAHWSRLWEMNGLITGTVSCGTTGSRAGDVTEGPGRRKAVTGKLNTVNECSIACGTIAGPWVWNWATHSSAAPWDEEWRMGDAPQVSFQYYMNAFETQNQKYHKRVRIWFSYCKIYKPKCTLGCHNMSIVCGTIW